MLVPTLRSSLPGPPPASTTLSPSSHLVPSVAASAAPSPRPPVGPPPPGGAMTHVHNDPAAFKDEVIRGFALAHPSYVERVEGSSGFVRAGGPTEGKVSLLIGGGSG